MDFRLSTFAGFSLATAIVFLPFSILLCHLGLGALILCWAAEGNWREKKDRLTTNPVVWGFILLFLLHLAGVAYSENSSEAWFNVEKKISILLLPVLIATLPGFSKETVRVFLFTFVASCVVGTVICLAAGMIQPGQGNFDGATLSLYQRLNPTAASFWLRFSYIELASGIGMHPTYFAMYLAFCLVILFHVYADSLETLSLRKKVALIALFLYLVVFIVLLSSRVVTLAMMMLCVAGFFSLPRRPLYPRAIVIFALITMVTLVAAYPVPRYRSLQEPFMAQSYRPEENGVYAYSTGIRKSLWILGNLSIAEVNPVFGTGTGDVGETLKKMSERHGIYNSMASYDPHNEFIFIQVGLGLSGLLCLIACLALPAWSAYRQRNFMYLSFLFLFVIVCMTESALESQKGIVFFTIFNSILVFQYNKHAPVVSGKLIYG
jgi:succinate-acetate transporter protein